MKGKYVNLIPATGEGLASVLSHYQDRAFLELKTLLEPFGIMQFYTDDWETYERHLHSAFHTIGKVKTQMIERKHLTLRTYSGCRLGEVWVGRGVTRHAGGTAPAPPISVPYL